MTRGHLMGRNVLASEMVQAFGSLWGLGYTVYKESGVGGFPAE